MLEAEMGVSQPEGNHHHNRNLEVVVPVGGAMQAVQYGGEGELYGSQLAVRRAQAHPRDPEGRAIVPIGRLCPQ